MGKKNLNLNSRGLKNMATTYSPRKTQVPSAMRGLTTLFGMGRGEHPRQNHHKKVKCECNYYNSCITKLHTL